MVSASIKSHVKCKVQLIIKYIHVFCKTTFIHIYVCYTEAYFYDWAFFLLKIEAFIDLFAVWNIVALTN